MSAESVNIKSVNLVSYVKLLYILAYCFDLPGYRSPQDRLFWLLDAQLYSIGEPEGERDIEGSDSAIPDIHCCCKDFDEYLIVPRSRFFHLLEL